MGIVMFSHHLRDIGLQKFKKKRKAKVNTSLAVGLVRSMHMRQFRWLFRKRAQLNNLNHNRIAATMMSAAAERDHGYGVVVTQICNALQISA